MTRSENIKQAFAAHYGRFSSIVPVIVIKSGNYRIKNSCGLRSIKPATIQVMVYGLQV